VEPKAITVLVFGASNVLYSDAGPEDSLFALIEKELRSAAPDIDWKLVAAEIPPARNMADRAVATVRDTGATAAYYMPSSTYFAYDFVIGRVRRRYPWAAGFASRLGGGIKSAAGGEFEGVAGPRGLLYRLPHRLAEAVIGAEPYIRTEHAIENTVTTMRRLAEIDGFYLVAREPFTRIRTSPKKLAKYLERIARYRHALREACAAAGFACYSLPDYMAQFGLEPLYVDDQIHMTLETRRYEARAAAGHLLARLAAPPESANATAQRRAIIPAD
jgi:hypothetical protein